MTAPDNDEFYIGYLAKAPKKTGSFIRKVIVLAAASICAVAIVLSLYQRKFSDSVFEYGINSKVEGYYFEKPVPHLAVPLGLNSSGKEMYQNVILVGPGKAGAREVVMRITQNEGKSLIGAKVELTGFMIHGDGKALLQVTFEDNDNLTFLAGATAPKETLDSSAQRSVAGEIVDPKCYFGVMKPGEGKAHRACAIRCIAGGIPPVLHADSPDDYFLIVNEKWEPVNEDVLDIVGDHIILTGKEITWNDWKILKIDSKDLRGVAATRRLTKQLASFGEGLTICRMDPQ